MHCKVVSCYRSLATRVKQLPERNNELNDKNLVFELDLFSSYSNLNSKTRDRSSPEHDPAAASTKKMSQHPQPSLAYVVYSINSAPANSMTHHHPPPLTLVCVNGPNLSAVSTRETVDKHRDKWIALSGRRMQKRSSGDMCSHVHRRDLLHSTKSNHW